MAWLNAVDGCCSFCGKHCSEIRTLVGTERRDARICDECLGWCCAILAEDIGVRNPAPSSRPPDLADPQVRADVSELLRRHAEHREEVLADIRSRPVPARVPRDEFWCSFCDAARSEVLKFIAGGRSFICDRCIGDATGMVFHVLP
jgi:ATP-dependent protease Clp ATPase subunit